MYSIIDLHAIESAEAALAAVAEYFGLASRSSNGTSIASRREDALRVQALAALEALATIDTDTEPVDPRLPILSTAKPLAELLLERGFDPTAPEPADETPLEVLAASLPPLAGGAPCYGPTTADLDEYELWLNTLDADRRAFHEMVREIHEGRDLN